MKSVLEFLKGNPILTAIIVVFLMFGLGFAGKNKAEKFYSEYYEQQFNTEKEALEQKYAQQIKDLEEAKKEAEDILSAYEEIIAQLEGVINGLNVRENNINRPETYDEIQDRFRRLGYETNIINSTSNINQ